MYEAYLSTS